MLEPELKSRINPELKMQLQTYVKVLEKLRDGIDLTRFAEVNHGKLEKLLLQFFAKKLPRKDTIFPWDFGQRDNKENERALVAWKKEQPVNVTQLVTRPDGAKGVLINSSESSGTWFEMPKDFSKYEIKDFLQTVIATKLLMSLVYSENKTNVAKNLTQQQMLDHIDWVMTLILI